MRLLLLFVGVPLIELMLLLKLAEVTTVTWTFALVVFTGVLGATLARRQGWGVLHRLQTELQSGQMPTTTVVDALMIFVAGALLLTPGILTDVFGFSLLIPICRSGYRKILANWFRNQVHVQGGAAGGYSKSGFGQSGNSSWVFQSWSVGSGGDGTRGGADSDPRLGPRGSSEIIDAKVIDSRVRSPDEDPSP